MELETEFGVVVGGFGGVMGFASFCERWIKCETCISSCAGRRCGDDVGAWLTQQTEHLS